MKKICGVFAVMALFLTMVVSVAAAQSDEQMQNEKVKIYFDDALRMSFEDMLALQDLDVRLRDLRMKHTDMQHELRSLERNQDNEIRRYIQEIYRQIENLQLQQAIIRLSRENTIRGMVAAISGLNAAVELHEMRIGLAETNLYRMRVSYSLGVISSHEMRTIERGVIDEYTRLNDLRERKESAIQNLNLLIGQPFDQHTVIVYERYVPEIPEDLDDHIRSKVLQAPSIRQAQNAVESARAERRAYTNNDRDIRITENERRRAMQAANSYAAVMEIRNRISLQEAVEQAETTREQAIRSMDFALRQAYIELEALLTALETAYREHALAESNLDVSRINLSVGRITRFDVSQAELTVANARQSIESIYYDLWILGFRLKNPEVL